VSTTDHSLRQAIEGCLPDGISPPPGFRERLCVFLDQLLEVNQSLNLTSITAPREVAVKHVWDSLAPWRRLESARSLLDLGSGAGFPGLVLALAFPLQRVVLTESVGKKAAFLRSVVERLEVQNAAVRAERGEDVLRKTHVDVVVARAVGPAAKLLRLLRPVRGSFDRLVLYKGPGADRELAAAAPEARRAGLTGRVTVRYELPEGMGTRCVVEYERTGARGAQEERRDSD
jgi:16S rRNA (guanine527-N7)-methyltransferase